jgi:hypothetical protein
MSMLYHNQKDSYVALKSGKVFLKWGQAIDYLRATQDVDVRKMDRLTIKLLHACARVYVTQYINGPSTPDIIEVSLPADKKLAKRIRRLLFLKPLPRRTDIQVRYDNHNNQPNCNLIDLD